MPRGHPAIYWMKNDVILVLFLDYSGCKKEIWHVSTILMFPAHLSRDLYLSSVRPVRFLAACYNLVRILIIATQRHRDEVPTTQKP